MWRVAINSLLVAAVMSAFFCYSTQQMAIWPSLYPKAALVALLSNGLLTLLWAKYTA